MWIFLKESIFSQEWEVSPWLCETMSDQSPIVKSIPSAKVYSCRECKREICPKHQYGMIYEASQLKELLKSPWMRSTSSTAASRSPAKISVLQDLERAWQESEADCFSRSCAWPKQSSPDSYSWKTWRQLPPVGDCESLEKLPRWGMIVDGVLFPLQALEPFTDERDGSYWPTPQARAQTDTMSERRRHSPCLETCVMIATPTASQASKPIREPSRSRKNGEHGEDIQDSIGRLNPEMIGKKLSVQFVEYLMGYPDKWTDLRPLETQ